MTTGKKALLATILFLTLASMAAISGAAQAPSSAPADGYFLGPWEEESNNEPGQANGPLLSHGWYRGYPDKEDYFSIQLDKGGKITIDLFGHSGEPERAVQVLLWDDLGGENDLTRVYDPPYHIEYSGEKGLYFIEIHTDLTKRPDPSIPYRLRATFPMTHRSLLPIMVTNLPPSRPSDPSPAHASKGVSRPVELAWTGVDAGDISVSYDVYLEPGEIAPDRLVCNDVTDTVCDPGHLEPSTTYYWKAVSKDELGAVTDGPVWRFRTTTNRAPNEPSDPSPAVGSKNVSQSVTLRWTGGDPDGDSMCYDVYLGRVVFPEPEPVQLRCSNISYSGCTVGPLQSNSTFAWRVVSKDKYGAVTPGPMWVFTTGN